jgi:CheY-like chemotaxis protein
MPAVPIFVLSENTADADLLAFMLHPLPNPVRIATTQEQLVACMETELPAVIVVDGPTSERAKGFLPVVLNNARLQETKILYLTANPLRMDKAQYAQLDAILTKPVSREQLLKRVTALLV